MMVWAATAEFPGQGKGLFKTFLSEYGKAIRLGIIVLEAY